MSSSASLELKRFPLSKASFAEFETFPKVKESWPLVYILSKESELLVYVGETTNVFSRMTAHLSNKDKQGLETLHLISSDTFNKSATLDIEANLIKYLSGDGRYKLLNANLGLANHNYYQKKDVYWHLFQKIWQRLIAEGIAKQSIESIHNSDLFKYSPYKSLMNEQKAGVLSILESLAEGSYTHFVVNGGAGTGKTIIAIYLCKLLSSDLSDFDYTEFGEDELRLYELVSVVRARFRDLKIALVVPMASFRNTLKKVFANIKDLRSSMVLGPSDITKEPYDIILVDESHRLRRRVNLGPYFKPFDDASNRLGLSSTQSDELDWVMHQAKSAILFYDKSQSIKPSDIPAEKFEQLLVKNTTQALELKSQFRVLGGIDYVRFIDRVLSDGNFDLSKFYSPQYDLQLFHSLPEMIEKIQSCDKEYGLSRLIAGYSWKWISKKDNSLFDIEIDGVKLQWNYVSNDWINSQGAVHQVGCIHTTQGYDLNYAGVIFGNELSYNPLTKSIEIIPEHYHDRYGKQSVKDQNQLKQFILNIYKTILLRGIRGTYIYVCNPELRAYLAQYIPTQVKRPEAIKFLSAEERAEGMTAVPFLSFEAAAGNFGEAQIQEDVEWVALPKHIRPDTDFFAMRVVGESMNQIIPNGAVCLFKKYKGGSRNGRICLVELIDYQDLDTMSRFTVKEYRSTKAIHETAWEHTTIHLHPCSDDPSFKPIIIESANAQNLKIIAEFVVLL